MSAPTVFPIAVFDRLDEFLLEFAEHDKMISGGIASVGPAAAYSEVWEWGNVRQTKAGPKTTYGVNPDGEKVWLSIQAPYGYIKINENKYWEIINQELAKVEFRSTDPAGITQELEAATVKALRRIAKIISDTAPVASGELSDSFKVISPGEAILDEEDNSRTFALIGGE